MNNPTTYFDHTLTWGKGRQLKTFDANTYMYINSSIAGAATSAIFNFILDVIISNITVFLSVGGFIAGLLDLLSDKKLNNKITIPFK